MGERPTGPLAHFFVWGSAMLSPTPEALEFVSLL